MTTTREDAGSTSTAVPPGERSLVTGIRGLRWWATLLIALVLTLAGVAADVLRVGQLGLFYTICFPVGCLLAAVWARRSELFGPMVQPPLLLAVCVPLVVVATGSLPRSGGLASTLIAVGGPLINGFPVMAITTAVCLAIGFVRWRLQPWTRPGAGDPSGSRPARPSSGTGQAAKGASSKGSPDKGSGPKGSPGGGRPAGQGRPPADRDRPRQPSRNDDWGPGVYRVGGEPERERGRRPDQRPR